MKTKLLLILLGVGLVGATIWDFVTTLPKGHVVVNLDPSGSMDRKCAELAKATEGWLVNKPGIQQGSRLAMLTMGTDAINANGKLALEHDIPMPSEIIIGADPQEYRTAMDRMLSRIEQTCEAAPAGRHSPIYQMVRQSIEVLRGMGCKVNGTCLMLVKSDLEDDAHPLLRVLRHGDPLPTPLAGSLDNAGIHVEICGTAEVTARKGGPPPLSADERVNLWKQLFTHTELVTVRPFCDGGQTE